MAHLVPVDCLKYTEDKASRLSVLRKLEIGFHHINNVVLADSGAASTECNAHCPIVFTEIKVSGN